MAGPTLTLAVEIDVNLIPDADIGAVMEAVSSAGLAPVLEQIGELMGEYERANYANQGATFGEPWAPLSPRTIAEKQRLGYPTEPMVRTGESRSLMGDMMAIGDTSVETGVDTYAVPYLLHHQPESLGGNNTGGGRLPARVLVAFSGREVEEIRQMILDAIQERTGLTEGVSVVVLDGGAEG